MGSAGEGLATPAEKMDEQAIRAFRDRFNIPIPADKLTELPYFAAGRQSGLRYMHERRKAPGGYLPQMLPRRAAFASAGVDVFESLLKSTEDRKCPRPWRSCAC